ncbi:MAG: glutathione synthetase [Actinomycetaceae bacterium]|nr:glutathione synthetase [Actinomycetaceae bacterium]
MAKPRVTLVTSDLYPNLEKDEEALPDALSDAGMEPVIAQWDDPSVNWDNSGVCVVRSVRNYAARREEFLNWAHSVPRLLNHPDVLTWNSDKHYMIELEKRGVPIVPTTWLEPGAHLDKQRVHSRFPAHGDFVVKPAVSSGARDIGRYTANDTRSRMAAILHSMELLQSGRSVMVQRYLEDVDVHGELSLIYFNGLISHAVEKKAMLDPFEETSGELQKETIIEGFQPNAQEWEWGEKLRVHLHDYVKERMGHDLSFLFTRFDVIKDGKGSFHLMEVSLVDASLYLSSIEGGVQAFTDAIAARVFW